MAKVAAFYKQQPGSKLAGQTQVVIEFNGKGVKVSLQSPWVDTTNFRSNTDTLIVIEKQ